MFCFVHATGPLFVEALLFAASPFAAPSIFTVFKLLPIGGSFVNTRPCEIWFSVVFADDRFLAVNIVNSQIDGSVGKVVISLLVQVF